ncbi:MAG TPA: copper chaperone PCu(A)C [Gammaproteobacteria bacterium]
MFKAVLAFVLMVLASLAAAAEGGLVVENAWIREAPPGARAMAGYMVVKNHGTSDKVLVGAASDAFGEVMLHRTIIEEGMAKMVHQMAITIPAKGEVTFEPNGYHVMLMAPKKPLKAGDKVEITLMFKDGETVKVVHEVRAAPAPQSMNDGMDHGAMSHHHH